MVRGRSAVGNINEHGGLPEAARGRLRAVGAHTGEIAAQASRTSFPRPEGHRAALTSGSRPRADWVRRGEHLLAPSRLHSRTSGTYEPPSSLTARTRSDYLAPRTASRTRPLWLRGTACLTSRGADELLVFALLQECDGSISSGGISRPAPSSRTCLKCARIASRALVGSRSSIASRILLWCRRARSTPPRT